MFRTQIGQLQNINPMCHLPRVLIYQPYQCPLQQNVFLVTKISEEIFFVTKNTALVTKYEFHH